MILTTITALLYPLAIQYKRGGFWKVLGPLAIITLILDTVASYTEWYLVFGKPRNGEHTITQRIKSMHNDPLESRRHLAKLIQTYLDACEPDGEH